MKKEKKPVADEETRKKLKAAFAKLKERGQTPFRVTSSEETKEDNHSKN